MRFNLDNEYLDVLKEELIDAQRIALDEDGRMLVWTGDAQAVTSQPAQTTRLPAAQEREHGDAGDKRRTPVEWPASFPHHLNRRSTSHARQIAAGHVQR